MRRPDTETIISPFLYFSVPFDPGLAHPRPTRPTLHTLAPPSPHSQVPNVLSNDQSGIPAAVAMAKVAMAVCDAIAF